MAVQKLQLDMRKRTKHLLDPRTSKKVPILDGMSAVGLLFIAIVTPVEVSFLQASVGVSVEAVKAFSCTRSRRAHTFHL